MTTSSVPPLDSQCEHCYDRVVETRDRDQRWIHKWRRRECSECGARISTVEVSLEYMTELRKLERFYTIERKIRKGLRDAGTYGSNFTAIP